MYIHGRPLSRGEGMSFPTIMLLFVPRFVFLSTSGRLQHRPLYLHGTTAHIALTEQPVELFYDLLLPK